LLHLQKEKEGSDKRSKTNFKPGPDKALLLLSKEAADCRKPEESCK
jgi:hypothetical protein